MKAKRLLSLFLILTLWLGLTACNATGTIDFDVTVDSTTATTATAVSTTVTDAPTDGTTDTTSDGTTTTIATDTTADGTSATGGSVTTTVTTVKPTTTTTTKKPTTTATTASSADKALVDRAFQLAQGEKLENVTLVGVVTSSQGYSAGYDNATFDLQVEGTSGSQTIYCYRVKPATTRTDVVEGDILSLTGTIQNYKGTIEFYPAEYTHVGGGITTTTTKLTTRPSGSGSAAIDEDGIYESKEDVALYLHTYGKLPKNFVTKSEYNAAGKPANLCCGGDRFYNKEGLLPNKSGRLYYECDIDTYGITSRGAKRIVYSNDGLIYYTGDHYASFTLLYGTP